MKLYSNVSIYLSVWLAAILVIFYFGFTNFPHSPNFSNDFFKNFANWDGGHFLAIAENGYQEKFEYAFFPFYPLTINILGKWLQNYLLAALIINFLAAFLGANMLYQLISMEFGKKIAQNTIFYLLIFPTSFFLLAVYSESLFLFLTLTAFLFFRKNKLFLATCFAALATATRLTGIFVAAGILIELIINRKLSYKNWYVYLSFSGLIVYCLFLYKQLGDPFYFLTAEEHWQRNLSIPVLGFWETIKSLSQPNFINEHFNTFLDLIFSIFGLGLIVRTFRFLSPLYSIYSLGSILLPLFTPTLSSMPRFLLPIFPIFIIISLIKNPYLMFAYQLISTMLLAAFAVLFINGYWVS